jgi:hypothetical protein
MRSKLKVLACVASIAAPCVLATAVPVAALDEKYNLDHVISMPGTQIVGAFDISFVSLENGTYALAMSRTSATGTGPASGPIIAIVDTAFDVVVSELKSSALSGACSIPPARDDFSGPNGVMVVEKGGNADVWAGNGPIYTPSCAFPGNPAHTAGTLATGSNVVVWDLNTGDLKGVIPVGKGTLVGKARADELCYNPKSDVVLVANDDPVDSFITFIGEDSLAVQDVIRFDGTDPNGNMINANGIEQCAFNPRDGKFYLNIPITGGATGTGPGVVLRISASAPHHVEAAFTIATSTGCVGPQGLSVGPENQLALGCGGPNSLIVSDKDGSTIATIAGAGGTDEDWYNPGSNEYFFAASTPAHVFVADAGGKGVTPAQDTSIATASGSHSVAADPTGNRVYVPIRGSAVGGSPTVCGSSTDVFGAAGSNTAGCVAVYVGVIDGDDCLPKGTPVVAIDPDGNKNFLKASCGGKGHNDDK